MAQVSLKLFVFSDIIPNLTKKIGVIQLDPWLEPHRDVLKHRYQVVEEWAKTINETEGGLDKFSKVNDIPIDCYLLN